MPFGLHGTLARIPPLPTHHTCPPPPRLVAGQAPRVTERHRSAVTRRTRSHLLRRRLALHARIPKHHLCPYLFTPFVCHATDQLLAVTLRLPAHRAVRHPSRSLPKSPFFLVQAACVPRRRFERTPSTSLPSRARRTRQMTSSSHHPLQPTINHVINLILAHRRPLHSPHARGSHRDTHLRPRTSRSPACRRRRPLDRNVAEAHLAPVTGRSG